MTTEHDEPPRLFDGGDDELRAALGEAKRELPSEARLDAIFLKLPSGGGGGGGEAPPAPPPPASRVGVGGAALGLAGVAILGGAIYLGVRANAPPTAPSSAPTVSAPSRVASAPNAMIPELAPTASSVARVSSTEALRPATPSPPGASVAPSASVPARSESDILREAQANASSSPSRAIALCDEHARLYPSGALSEEREFIRIQALMAAGRVGEARALADAFEARHPGSAHSLRLQEIVGKAKPAPSSKP